MQRGKKGTYVTNQQMQKVDGRHLAVVDSTHGASLLALLVNIKGMFQPLYGQGLHSRRG